MRRAEAREEGSEIMSKEIWITYEVWGKDALVKLTSLKRLFRWLKKHGITVDVPKGAKERKK